MLVLLDYLFHFLHLVVIIVNLTFWMSFKTLRIAQASLVLTVISWVGFGTFYGFGYCFLTDWHWQIKGHLGERDLPLSYVKYMLDRTTGLSWNADLVDKITVMIMISASIGCVVQTFRERRQKRARGTGRSPLP